MIANSSSFGWGLINLLANLIIMIPEIMSNKPILPLL